MSSLALTTKAAPQSTSQSQVTTLNSEVQPIGKLKKYRKTICRMKATNIAASNPAATFSARRLSQAPVVCSDIARLFQRVDLLQHPLRPLLRLVGCQVDLPRMRPECVDIWGVDLEAVLLLESIGQLRLALHVLRRAPGERLVHRRLERLLLRRRHAVPSLQVQRAQVVSDHDV